MMMMMNFAKIDKITQIKPGFGCLCCTVAAAAKKKSKKENKISRKGKKISPKIIFKRNS